MFTFFSQFLASFILFSASSSSGERFFYLSLVPSTNLTEEGGEFEGELGSDSPVDSRTCSGVSCTCEEPLMNARRGYEERLNSACAWFDEIEDASDFSFCTNTLLRAGYEISKEFIDAPTFGLDEASLNRTLRELENQLRIFRVVLDRTLSGILAESDSSKCFCFVSDCFVSELTLSCGRQG